MSGSFRVKVYAGTDPVTGKARLLRQTCPGQASLMWCLVGQALGRYLEVAELEVSTREAHEGYIGRTIGAVLGEVKVRQLGADSLDVLYTALKSARDCAEGCRVPSTMRTAITHATSGADRYMTT